jgi:hypothetical protein
MWSLFSPSTEILPTFPLGHCRCNTCSINDGNTHRFNCSNHVCLLFCLSVPAAESPAAPQQTTNIPPTSITASSMQRIFSMLCLNLITHSGCYLHQVHWDEHMFRSYFIILWMLLRNEILVSWIVLFSEQWVTSMHSSVFNDIEKHYVSTQNNIQKC